MVRNKGIESHLYARHSSRTSTEDYTEEEKIRYYKHFLQSTLLFAFLFNTSCIIFILHLFFA